MMGTGSRGLTRKGWALLPWIAAALVWFALVAPMRADQGNRLTEQSRTRRERLKSEGVSREIDALRARMAAALGSSCRASTDPAALRQVAIAATSGLALSPFALTVTGGAAGGAQVEAAGTPRSALELLSRLGDPARGAFLRSATVREKGGRFSVSAVTGVLTVLPAGLSSTGSCKGPAEPAEPEPGPVEAAPSPKVRTPPSPRPSASARVEPLAVVPPPQEQPPFALVGFLTSGGKVRVSVKVGDEVRVISEGDQVAGWRCLSIDRDEGAVFASGTGARAVLIPRP